MGWRPARRVAASRARGLIRGAVLHDDSLTRASSSVRDWDDGVGIEQGRNLSHMADRGAHTPSCLDLLTKRKA